jgi:hypothetical protein
MAAIGNSPTQQAFTPAIDYFSGNGSTTAFTLSRPVASVAQVQVTIDNVAQNPSSAYTVSANTITFTSAPLSGTNNIYVYYTSPITQVIAPGQGTVTSDSFGTITNFTTTGNTVLGDATTDTLTVGVTGIVKDSSGNVGIGTTPNAWSGYKGVQINNGNNAYGALAVGSYAANTVFDITANSYTSAAYGDTYIGTGYATKYRQYAGQHQWLTAPSGTAGTAVTYTSSMTLDSNNVLNLPNPPSGDAHVKIQQGAVTTLGAVASSGISIGGGGSNNQLCQIGLGYSGTYQPTAITSSTVVQTGYTYADLLFATRSVNTDTAPTTRMKIGSDGRVYIPNAYTETTGNSANLFVDTDGRLIRATSSLKYKQNVQDATHGLTDLLKLRSVTYQGKSESDADKTFGGLIAEEVHAAGLTEFVQYAEDGSPDALAYGNMVSLCVKAIQELKAINDTLTARIVALEGR